MQRYLFCELLRHFEQNRQMAFVSGSRQVGKTTLAQSVAESFTESQYLNWDDQAHRALILQGAEAVAKLLELDHLKEAPSFCAFDELHKYRQWRDFLKGLFDRYEDRLRIMVTGSASLRTFSRGGESLMGRYFPYRLHPLSVPELNEQVPVPLTVVEPKSIDDEAWEALWRFGGFPEPFLKANLRFHTRWRTLRTEQLFREDLRNLTRIQELDQVEILAELLRQQVGHLTSFSFLAKNVRVSVDTVRRWISTLESLYYCFTVKPWHRNVARALRKEPKYYLWDWSQIEEEGARAENFVASALLKAVHWWTDTGQGDFELRFVRDKQKREADFLVIRANKPWFLVEVKQSENARLSPALAYFQDQTGAKHAFQIAMDGAFVARDCFEIDTPVIVPARTLLAQLV